MVATVHIYEINGEVGGAGPTKTRVDDQGANAGTDVRFCTKDAFDPVATSPCIIPADGTGFHYSYWKHLYLDISGIFTTLNNIRFYTDSSIGWTCGDSGGLFVGTHAGDNGCPLDTDYDQASGTEGTSGDEITAQHAYYSAVADASVYTSGSTLTVDTTDYSAADESKAVVLQVKLDTAVNNCVQGTQSSETLTFIYDEI